MIQNFINDIFVMIFTHFDQMIQMNKFALSGYAKYVCKWFQEELLINYYEKSDWNYCT
jgi:hypothetical protein